MYYALFATPSTNPNLIFAVGLHGAHADQHTVLVEPAQGAEDASSVSKLNEKATFLSCWFF